VIIFQTKPRLVFENNGRVYKFFKNNEDCRSEVQAIESCLLKPSVDHISDYKIAFVEVVDKYEDHYVMKMVCGTELASELTEPHCSLAGRWLRFFHNVSIHNGYDKRFLFGDFSISHVYIDNVDKTITAIDPGAGFGSVGPVESDLSRFIVSLLQSRAYKRRDLGSYISAFILAYGPQQLDFVALYQQIKFRINRNLTKRVTLRSGVLNKIKAYSVFFQSYIKVYLIFKVLKSEFYNEN
jgi:hypothetical protein